MAYIADFHLWAHKVRVKRTKNILVILGLTNFLKRESTYIDYGKFLFFVTGSFFFRTKIISRINYVIITTNVSIYENDIFSTYSPPYY